MALGALAIGAPFTWPSVAKAGRMLPGIAVSELPKGAAPKPVSFPHFPSRLHAFVWRNWPLVTVERMARVVGAKRVDIVRLGRAMGLGNPPRISRDQLARSYLTVIKRNWHLLPYEQLLELLDWTPEQMAFTLREDDFLYVKLGNLKPECESLRQICIPQACWQLVLPLDQTCSPGVRAEANPLPQFRQRIGADLANCESRRFLFITELGFINVAKPR